MSRTEMLLNKDLPVRNRWISLDGKKKESKTERRKQSPEHAGASRPQVASNTTNLTLPQAALDETFGFQSQPA